MIEQRVPSSPPSVIAPVGNSLVDLMVDPHEAERLSREAAGWPSIILSARSMCDLELLAVGAFSPVDRFLGREDYVRVLEEMRLMDGTLWPLPIMLPINRSPDIRLDHPVALRSPQYDLLAVLTVEELFDWNFTKEVQAVVGTTDVRHPLVAEMSSWGPTYLSGRPRVLNLPKHHDFVDLRRTPAQLRQQLRQLRAERVVAFQPSGLLTLSDEQFAKETALRLGGTLLLNPIVGLERQGGLDHFTRVRACRIVVDTYCDVQSTVLSLWPLAMRYAGPREALWEALIGRNYGVSHMIVSYDHGEAGLDSEGCSFYASGSSQKLVGQFEAETGVAMIPQRNGQKHKPLASGPFLHDGAYPAEEEPAVSPWRPEVARLVAQVFPPPDRNGVCIWFTGLSGAGKSSVAEILTQLLKEYGRKVTLLDGDVVRTHLSKGLTFSKDDRDMNIRRIGFVASEIVRHQGVVVCAAVSPYRSTRNEIRNIIGEGRFVEVYVNTPIEVCELRDTKGMYARARKGELRGFTGVDDPYEAPLRPELSLSTTDCTAMDNAQRVVRYLKHRGFIANDGSI